MSLVVGTNSYISVADSNLYFLDRFVDDFSSDWSDIDDDIKAKLLISSSSYIDNLFDHYYEKTDVDQVLEYPRNLEEEVPTRILNAVCELALYIYDNGYTFSAEPTSLKIDKVTVTTNGLYTSLPEYILALMRPFAVFTDRSKKIVEAVLVR